MEDQGTLIIHIKKQVVPSLLAPRLTLWQRIIKFFRDDHEEEEE